MESAPFNTSLITVLFIIAGIAVVALLYRYFSRERDAEGDDVRNWVNDSNYNVATSDNEAAAIANASPAEAQHLVEVNKAEGPYPPSEQEFGALERKLDDGGLTSDEVREELRDV